jgi:hypothetical protein
MLNNAIASRKSDNNQNGARAIGDLTGTKKFRGAVGTGDKADFYSFTLKSRSSFNLSLNKLKNNVDVFLQQGKQVVARSTKGGKKPEAISATLEAGTYFIKVSQKSGNSKYKLTLNTTPLSSSGTPPVTPQPTGRRWVSFENGIAKADPDSGLLSLLYERNPAQVADAFTDIAAFGNEVYATTKTGLYKIDPNNGSPSFVGNLSGNEIRSLGFTDSGVLYGTGYSPKTSGGFSPAGLFSIDRTTGTTTALVSDSYFGYVTDIAYDATSSRFLASYNVVFDEGFFTFNVTGIDFATKNNLASPQDGLAFDNGKLYGYASGSQDELNPANGDRISYKFLTFDPQTPLFIPFKYGNFTGAA